ncbi:hypothetical protein B0H21DRAFT_748720 [Amylocystis lapponica]|nr:hypothetical protein B0H21DRAFT_748720 [Amylocystis lapponica]
MTPARIAIVTGAAQGIGRQIALRLADDGLDVAVSDLPSQASLLEAVAVDIRQKGRRSLAIFADVSVEKDVHTMVEQAVAELGGLDVMVANAGIATLAPILEITMEEFDRVFAINVKGTLLCYQAAAKVMIGQGRGGRLIGASSVAGKKGIAYYGSYSTSKFAVRALTQTAASEFGRHNITVNAYAPGLIETELRESTILYPVLATSTKSHTH